MVNTAGFDTAARTLITELRSHLRTTLVAYLAEAPDTATVHGWVDGTTPLPDQTILDRLHIALDAARRISARDTPPSSKPGTKDETRPRQPTNRTAAARSEPRHRARHHPLCRKRIRHAWLLTNVTSPGNKMYAPQRADAIISTAGSSRGNQSNHGFSSGSPMSRPGSIGGDFRKNSVPIQPLARLARTI